MGTLFSNIIKAIEANRFIVSNHADDRLRERMIELWTLTASVDDARLIVERPNDTPNPSIVLEQTLPDGTTIRVVWSYVDSRSVAVLVTVHFIDR
jgi:hypothetical protein